MIAWSDVYFLASEWMRQYFEHGSYMKAYHLNHLSGQSAFSRQSALFLPAQEPHEQ